jgi:uncharacterized DUF497 family protein
VTLVSSCDNGSMSLLFEWDASKAPSNLKKHGISFEEATTIFGDRRAIAIESSVVGGEKRVVTIGRSATGRFMIVVVHTDRIRIISARLASRAERKQYEGR